MFLFCLYPPESGVHNGTVFFLQSGQILSGMGVLHASGISAVNASAQVVSVVSCFAGRPRTMELRYLHVLHPEHSAAHVQMELPFLRFFMVCHV